MIALSKETVFFDAVLRRDFERIGRGEGALAGHHRHLALLGHARQAAGQPFDDAVLPAAQFVQIDLRRGESDAVGAKILAPRR